MKSIATPAMRLYDDGTAKTAFTFNTAAIDTRYVDDATLRTLEAACPPLDLDGLRDQTPAFIEIGFMFRSLSPNGTLEFRLHRGVTGRNRPDRSGRPRPADVLIETIGFGTAAMDPLQIPGVADDALIKLEESFATECTWTWASALTSPPGVGVALRDIEGAPDAEIVDGVDGTRAARLLIPVVGAPDRLYLDLKAVSVDDNVNAFYRVVGRPAR